MSSLTGNWVFERPMAAATRSAIASASAPAGIEIEASFAMASSGVSSSWIPAASRATSASGQKVMPSP